MHFKFPGLARVLNLYCIFVYSVIDPSGTFILGLVLAVDLLSGVLIVSVAGGAREVKLFEIFSISYS